MSISIEIATQADADEMLEIGKAAFANDLLNKAMFNLLSATPAEMEEFNGWRTGMTRLRMQGEGKYWFKAVDESTGSIVGYSAPKCVNQGVIDELESVLQAAKEECMGDRQDYWFVQSMAVHPACQGRGIARRLLERGLQGADEAGQDVYLEGTAAAQPLYRRCGFEDLRDMSILDGTYRMKAMIRRAKSRKTTCG